MKKLLIILCLLFATPIAGCTALGQSNAAHHSLQDHDYAVDKVVVKVKNGEKSVNVFIFGEVDKEAREEIKALVMEQIPDAKKVRVKVKK
jgi:hypothetical protein